MKKSCTRLLLPLLGIASTAPLGFAGQFQNGSFEVGVNAPVNGTRTLNAGSTDMTGWTTSLGDMEWVSLPLTFPGSDGDRWLGLANHGQGAIAQTFDTAASTKYDVTFDLAGAFSGRQPTQVVLEVSAAGQSQTYTFDIAQEGQNTWKPRTFSFTAIGGSTTLMFKNGNADAAEPFLDNVKVLEAVPEPASMVCLAAGAGGLLVRRRKR